MSEIDEAAIVRNVIAARNESYDAKRNRMLLNRDNYEMYQLRHDFSHKRRGQSTEVLSKQRMAVEQIKSFFQQALTDVGEWWTCSAKDGTEGEGMVLKPYEVFLLTNYMLKKADYFSHVGLTIQSALLGSLAITKVHGQLKPKPKFKTREEGRGKSYRIYVEAIEDKSWELKFDMIRQENYYPDPTNKDIYEVEDGWLDMHVVKQLSEGDDAIYDKAVVDTLTPWSPTDVQESRKAVETGQNLPLTQRRPQVKITEYWGTLIDRTTGDILCENCVITIANDLHVIRKPTENPLWHQRSPIISAALLEVANSKWGIALMDAPTKHNRASIEIYNLILDAAMKSVHGVNQIRIDALQNPSQVSDGIPWGTNLQVNSSLQPGQKVMESVITGEVPNDALNVLNIINQEFNASALTNDLRQGVMPFRSVKATEVVEASNTITSVFQGIAKNVEMKIIQKELELAWMTISQNLDRIDKDVLVSLFGRERGEAISQLKPQEVFVGTVNGVKFDVFGISLTLSKSADFRKYTQIMQTIGSSEIFMEAFLKEYDVSKFVGEILTSLNIDKYKIKVSPNEAQNNGAALQQPGNAPGAPGGAGGQASQVPQAGAGSLSDILGTPKFPGSPATAGQGQQQ